MTRFTCPGGTGLTTPIGAVRRGIGYALGMKNFAFSEAFDDFSEARVVVTAAGAEVHTAAVEVGQGLVTVMQQIARSALGIAQVAVDLRRHRPRSTRPVRHRLHARPRSPEGRSSTPPPRYAR